MKFKFKIQDYQTEAVDAVVKAFEGQSYNDKVLYMRDLGSTQAWKQASLFADDATFVAYVWLGGTF